MATDTFRDLLKRATTDYEDDPSKKAIDRLVKKDPHFTFKPVFVKSDKPEEGERKLIVFYAEKSPSVDSSRSGTTGSKKPKEEGENDRREGREGGDGKGDGQDRRRRRSRQSDMTRWKSFYGDDDFNLAKQAIKEWPIGGPES